MFRSLLSAFFVSAIAENLIFTRSFGSDAVPAASGSPKKAAGFSAAVTYMCVLSNFFAWAVGKAFGRDPDYKLFQPVFYISILCLLYFASVMTAFKLSGKKAAVIRKYLHFAVFNSAVPGTMFLCSLKCRTLWEYLVCGFGSGAGFSLAVLMTCIVRDKLDSERVPGIFKGFPLTMIYLGILGMAFFGFTGSPMSC